MWLMYRLAPEGTAYNMPFASRQMGPLNKSALRRTIDAICGRHEAFRTTFAMTGEGPVQIVSPFRPPHWVEVDLSQLPSEQRWREAARLVEYEANQPFDLEKGPLAKFLLIEVEPEDHVLVLTMHHIIGRLLLPSRCSSSMPTMRFGSGVVSPMIGSAHSRIIGRRVWQDFPGSRCRLIIPGL
jgi:hypothetical protein